MRQPKRIENTVCERVDCVNNINGECPVIMEWAPTKKGTQHHLVLAKCPFWKEKPNEVGRRKG